MKTFQCKPVSLPPADLFDTHLHLIDLQRWRYGWLAHIPALNRSWSLAEYCADSVAVGISGALFMEAFVDEPYEMEEALWAEALSRDASSGVRGFVRGARFERHAEAAAVLAHRPAALCGLRRVLHVESDEFSASPAFRDNLRVIEGTGLPFELCVKPDQLEIAFTLASEFPGMTFVLDHGGNPPFLPGGFNAWRQALRQLASLRNVWCKMSGLGSGLPAAEVSMLRLAPYLESMMALFGADRVVWGSDWPICNLTSSLARWVDITRGYFAAASPDERAAVFHRNAARLYGVRSLPH